MAVEAVDAHGRARLGGAHQAMEGGATRGNAGAVRSHVELDEDVPRRLRLGLFEYGELLLIVHEELDAQRPAELGELREHPRVDGEAVETLGGGFSAL